MSAKETYLRFKVDRRIEHLLLVLSFSLLGLTGLIQKYATAGISEWLIALLGGIEMVRIIHRVAAVVFLLEGIYHLILAGYMLYVQKVRASMLPGAKDLTDVIQFVKFNLGLGKKHPEMGRYSFVEKAEYWALIWGFFMMGLTGFILWNPIITSRALPGEFIPAAKAAHGLEAVLAVLAILLWHFYSVHIRSWNWSMIKGTVTKKQMEEEHAKEMEEIAKGEVGPRNTPETQKKRLRIFIPVAAVLTAGMLFIVYLFVFAETTAIKTLPPVSANVPSYSRQTATKLPTQVPTATKAPTATLAPTNTPVPGATQAPTATTGAAAALTWASGIGDLFAENCKACHGAMGGLSVGSYADTLKGGVSGKIIIPGDLAGSTLIKTMEGTHAKVFSPADLEKIKAWIKVGALEK